MFNIKNTFKELKNKDIPKDALLRQRKRLEAYMLVHPMHVHPKVSVFQSFALKPALALLTIMLVFSSTGGVVFASQNSLPGEGLYPVKIVSEEVRAHLALSKDAKFRYRSKLAEKRLEEVEKIIALTDKDEEKREKHVSIAMRRYEHHVDRLNGIAEKFAEQNRPKDPERAFEAVHRVLGIHARLLESATSTNDESNATVAAYAKGAIDLEEKLMKRFRGMKNMPDNFEERRELMEENMLRLREHLRDAEELRENLYDDEDSDDNEDEEADMRWPKSWNDRDWGRDSDEDRE